MTGNKVCRVCGTVLDSDNWYPSNRIHYNNICITCMKQHVNKWCKNNPNKVKINHTRFRRKMGERPFNENSECASYLGVHIAERVLGHVFKRAVRMPWHNPGFDFVCGQGYKIDVKSSCLNKCGKWRFGIRHNIIADYFLCIAFDDRIRLTPLHALIIPGHVINHLAGLSISPSTTQKWGKYKIDISKIEHCCNELRS